ncbi:MAG: cytochrome-c oxidase, cbb3-type subunit I [Polyangiaceae bacterium]|nr:cytochrome-c oxidase, cbb3-type subunit I [Polyangiaceae bacterium]
MTAATRREVFDDEITRKFVIASVGWGIVGLLVGLVVATQLFVPALNVGPYFTFGRLRPLHTNAIIFAFVGNMMFAGIYYSSQRLLRTRMASPALSKVHFWGWQAIIVAAAITLPLGITQSKEYAELEWPIDIAIAVVWVLFGVNFFLTLKRRRERHLYVGVWFYIATIITVAVLHVVNSLSLPLDATKSYSIYPGVKDALVQWWYGHNAVAFVLTTPILGIMYYFVPKAAERPVYSYRLSIVHFWALVFLYIWAGPHHLLYTALPPWAQTLGMVFSLMLWAPSWGGMINGLLTLRSNWTKVRTDPVLKFFAAAITFYGMATFEGPLLSIKNVSALAHYTDWIVAHVHAGALGWNGLMAAGMFYWLVPRLYGTKLHSDKLANLHFWLATFGILFYVAALWTAGIAQGLMLRALTPDGALAHPDFLETVMAIRWPYIFRAVGGGAYLAGFVLMAYNLWRTARSGQPFDGSIEVEEEEPPQATPERTWQQILLGRPLVLTAIGGVLLMAVGLLPPIPAVVATCAIGALVVTAWVTSGGGYHHALEGKAFLFSVLTVVAVLIGGVAELVPAVVLTSRGVDPRKNPPYTPLQLEGRDVYVREGCYTCHSQMIRPLYAETLRYGNPSTIEESAWDHPFQWGSKRTGPDLARVGGKYPDVWHQKHMIEPRAVTANSIMPAYPHLATARVDLDRTSAKLRAMRTLGIPYEQAEIDGAKAHALAEGEAVSTRLRADGVTLAPDTELTALIAYLQRLGKPTPKTADGAAPVAQKEH